MPATVLSARSTRRIARTTGLDVVRGWGIGGYWMPFVTADHRHGMWHRYDHTVRWWHASGEDVTWVHFWSCTELFPAAA